MSATAPVGIKLISIFGHANYLRRNRQSIAVVFSGFDRQHKIALTVFVPERDANDEITRTVTITQPVA